MNIGLVLSGGMAKGAYQVGALQAVKEFITIDDIKYMSCASVGVLNGYAFATGGLDRIKRLWMNMCTGDTRILISRVLKSNLLQHNIKEICCSKKNINAVLYCALLDYTHKELVYKNLSSVSLKEQYAYLKASVAMPIYNKSVLIGDKRYYDGAIVDNIPIFPLFNHNPDYIICIYFDDVSYSFDNPYYDNKIIRITFPSNFKVKQSIIMTKESIEYMIVCGYERTKQILSKVFANGYGNLNSIYSEIENKNRTEQRSIRVTGDVVVTNLNKLTQKLAKRRIIL